MAPAALAAQRGLTIFAPSPNGFFVFRGQTFVMGSTLPAAGAPNPPVPSFTASNFGLEVGPI